MDINFCLQKKRQKYSHARKNITFYKEIFYIVLEIFYVIYSFFKLQAASSVE